MVMNDFKILKKKCVSSTNDEAKELLKNDIEYQPVVVWADIQTEGRGHRGSSWYSIDGESLTFSIAHAGMSLPASRQFLISIAVSLGIIDFFRSMSLDLLIKWPNDLYFDNRKLGGILIENIVLNNVISSSVIGIGLNVNQEEFPGWLPNPVSLRQVIGSELLPGNIIEGLVEKILNRLNNINLTDFEALKNEYLTNLLGYLQKRHYKSESGDFYAKITGIAEEGWIRMLTDQGQELTFGFKEVELVD